VRVEGGKRADSGGSKLLDGVESVEGGGECVCVDKGGVNGHGGGGCGAGGRDCEVEMLEENEGEAVNAYDVLMTAISGGRTGGGGGNWMRAELLAQMNCWEPRFVMSKRPGGCEGRK
jgi:hypothetical protein